MSDDLVKRLRDLLLGYPDCLHQAAAGCIETQAAEITRLRAALAAARREGMKDAAKWHEMRSMELSGKAGSARNFRQLLQQSDFHMESAAAIRAAAKEEKP